VLVDSHCHLDMLPGSQDITVDQAVDNARNTGVSHFLCVCVNLGDFPAMLSIAEQYEDVSASVGLHPNEVVDQEPTVELLVNMAQHDKVVAIGETGLDYYRTEQAQWQQDRFRTHIEVAKSLSLPLIIHSRQARDDTIAIMREMNATEAGGVMHCFTEDWAMAKKALDLGFYISFSGIVSFKNAHEVQEVAKKVPLDRMLIETDCPYLAPVPHRGKPNQPAYVKHVAEKIAELRDIAFAEVAMQTTKNFFTLFTNARS